MCIIKCTAKNRGLPDVRSVTSGGPGTLAPPQRVGGDRVNVQGLGMGVGQYRHAIIRHIGFIRVFICILFFSIDQPYFFALF